ncbi:hypothetical protein [Streptomyces noursei]|uniref:hypothetical protein n=1 Tax=Streptomyces noursei TaxID=1971 RepID=UPI0015E117EC|nr:hypothetical protein [Streptomyces noursei]
MSQYQPGDHVTVVAPIQPTGLRGGETGVVTQTRDDLVRLRRDDNGHEVVVYAAELRRS